MDALYKRVVQNEIVVRIANYIAWIIVSIPANCIYWIFNFGKLKSALELRSKLRSYTKNVDDIKATMKRFKWTADKYIDWRPWVITILAREYKDDCDGAAALAHWLFKVIGMKAQKVVLTSKKGFGGHMVCITRGRTIMISNDMYVKLNPLNWEKDVDEFFRGRYNPPIDL